MADETENEELGQLNVRQRLFVNHYIANGLNATAAAKSAGYSPDTAYSMGSRLLKKVEIKALIDEFLDESAMSAKEVLHRLSAIARGSVEDFLDLPDPNPDYPNALQAHPSLDFGKAKRGGKLGLIKKFGYNEQGMPEIELYPADAALRDLGRHHKLFTDKTEIDANVRNLDAAEMLDRKLSRFTVSEGADGVSPEPDARGEG